jgi:hypothetical protein
MEAESGNNVKLDRLSDHDLLVRIATWMDGLPEQVDCNTHDIGRLDERVKSLTGVFAVIQLAFAGLVAWLNGAK